MEFRLNELSRSPATESPPSPSTSSHSMTTTAAPSAAATTAITSIATTTTTIPAPTTTSKYVRDFESLFVPIKVDQLRNRARNGNLRHCQFRSICWRYFLRCLPEKYDHWIESCAKSRDLYTRIKAKHASAKSLSDKQQHNQQPQQQSQSAKISTPATKTSASPSYDNASSGANNARGTIARIRELEEEQKYIKAANECDHKTVFRTIERDVIRTFPDMEFFRQSEMQDILSNVLFNFASENPRLSYKQGMHELLAALLYVLHTDYQNCLIIHEGGYANDTIATLLDIKYLEHDVFHLFRALMRYIETWYQNDDILTIAQPQQYRDNRHNSSNSNGPLNRSRRQQVGSVLGIKLKKISENVVKNYDQELFNHLEALQIAPQIYGIRWMRLLFGREFEFLDLLTVWDAMICDHVPMSLTDYVFASMLITIREELVSGDYTECLNNLMRHQFKDAQFVIKLALHLRDPDKNPRPKSIQKSVAIVDYCWRLLSEQIDSLQRCLAKEKKLNSEDEIFIALAQLKKVRDVLKGSLKLEDELELPSLAGPAPGASGGKS